MLRRSELARAIRKEQNRSDRFGLEFTILDLRLTPDQRRSTSERRRALHRFAESLEERLRLTDEKALVGPNRIQLLLPHTNRAAAAQVLHWIESVAEEQHFQLQSKIFSYPKTDSSGSPTPASESITYDTDLEVPYPHWKRASDMLGASAGLLITCPILLLCALAIKLDSNGPVFFRQWRTGHRGRHFQMIKLRTMRVGAEGEKAKLLEQNERDGPAFKMKDDPRITRVGKVLRRLGIDELPQLWNVLRGDMGLVGPRPLPCNEANQCLPWQRRRMDTKPGITCTWQVSKSREVSFEHWMRMDLKYNSSRSMRNDLKLLWKTVVAVVLGRVEH